MDLVRLRPASIARVRGARPGPCAACGKAIRAKGQTIRLHGEVFHHDCTFYRAAHRRER